ncbi:hypothetical protein GCM10023189_58660 [Nibrella saemangeumensis]|uniref:Outer membrane protein beta-barrel domain-containing protein n=2 Tax=Nibrella saemangeumensis TaxID=1084526 RepID=A0ABP8NSH4_9BACT
MTLADKANAQYTNWAIGFRLGEPAGINVRKYFAENRAFDLNIGTFGGLYGNNRDYLRGAYRSVGITLQGHYLFHNRLFGKDSFHGYYGIGGQVNSRRYYPDRLAYVNEYETRLSLGGSGVAGAEYFLPNRPLSVFLEVGLYAEALPSPLFFNIQSGIGLRLNL